MFSERKDFLTFSLGDGYSKNATHIQRMPDIRFPDALGISEDLLDKFQVNNSQSDNYSSPPFISKIGIMRRLTLNISEIEGA